MLEIASGSENPTSVQSFPQYGSMTTKTFMEARMHGASENELSNNDSEKDGPKNSEV